MKKIICLLFVLIGMCGQNAYLYGASRDVHYISVKSLAKKYDMNHERDPITGREIFSCNGTKLILCSGMRTYLVNEDVGILEDYAKIVKGKLAVPYGDLRIIENKLKEIKENYLNDQCAIKKVVIDPGHGGKFKGARGANGVLEKDINLSVALKVKRLLEAKGICVVMTRTTDRHLSASLNEDLNRRVAVANREQPDLFISIHCNWAKQRSAKGFEVYYSKNKPLPDPKLKKMLSNPHGTLKIDSATRNILRHALRQEYHKETIEFSKQIQKEFKTLPTKDRGIRSANFRVIKGTKCPSVLVELDFISNKKMSKKLSGSSYQQEVASKLVKSILNYQNDIKKAEGFVR